MEATASEPPRSTMLAMVPPCRMFKRFLRCVSLPSLDILSWILRLKVSTYRVLLVYMEIECDLAGTGSNDAQLNEAGAVMSISRPHRGTSHLNSHISIS